MMILFDFLKENNFERFYLIYTKICKNAISSINYFEKPASNYQD